MTGIYRFADLNIRICSLHEAVHSYCRDYRVEAAPDFTVETTAEDLDLERRLSAREDAAEGRPTRSFSDDYLEELAVYRKIAEQMPAYDRFLFHGSVIAVDGAAYLFTAPSGTGKSTHTRLWRELLGERAVMINDDKPLLRVTDSGVLAYGTPYDGKHRLSSNRSAPLKAICLLERSVDNRISPIERREAYPQLLQQVYRPLDRAALVKTLSLLDRAADTVRLYRLGCNMEPEAARLAYGTMKG